MIFAATAFLLAADLLMNPVGIPMMVTVELRVKTRSVLPGGELEIEGTVTNPTDTPVSGCIGAALLLRVEGSAETVRVPLADRNAGRCRTRGDFSLEPGRRSRWTATIPVPDEIGEGPGKVVANLAVYEWRRKIEGKKRDVRWEIVREAPFTAASR